MIVTPSTFSFVNFDYPLIVLLPKYLDGCVEWYYLRHLFIPLIFIHSQYSFWANQKVDLQGQMKKPIGLTIVALICSHHIQVRLGDAINWYQKYAKISKTKICFMAYCYALLWSDDSQYLRYF